MEFPERLTLQRKKKGFTQKVLAKNVGVEPNTVYKWESGLASPSNASMKRLAFALDTSTDYLMGETDDERRSQSTRTQFATVFYRQKTRPQSGFSQFFNHPLISINV